MHCCGFDSIPSDMGVYFLQQHARERFEQPCVNIKMRVKAMRGEFAGSTIASMLNIFKEALVNPELREELANPYSLCPTGHSFTAHQHKVRSAEYDADFEAWAAPFMMAAVNTRVVHRSNALSANAYGDSFNYDEAKLTGRGVKGWTKALGAAAGQTGLLLVTAYRPSLRALEKITPAPGGGPGPESRACGFFDLGFAGETAAGHKLFAEVTGDMDPGYGSTSKMLGQAGACMALDCAKADRPGGFWTPATMFGERLLQRLQAHAGLTFELLDRPLG